MTPYLEAKALYDGLDLANIVDFCATHGVVHCDSECFFAGYYTHSENINTNSKKVLDNSDTFFVYIASGRLNKAFLHLEPKKYIAFERNDGNVRLYDFDRFRRLCSG